MIRAIRGSNRWIACYSVARPVRLERTTCGFEVRRSIQLSYGRTPKTIRTMMQLMTLSKSIQGGRWLSSLHKCLGCRKHTVNILLVVETVDCDPDGALTMRHEHALPL